MAVTGLVLYGFVVAHMLGNLQVFLGPEAINAYGAFLHHFLHGQGLYLARAGAAGRRAAPRLGGGGADALELRAARPWATASGRRASRPTPRARWSGAGRCCCSSSLYHLAHFTTGTAHPEFVPGDVFRNMVVGFQNPFASAFYVLAMLALGLHMYHGFWSMLQTLGLSHPRWNRVRRARLAGCSPSVVVAGNISPIAVLSGVVHL